MNRLKEKYNKEIVSSLMDKYKYNNVMEVPKLEKIVVNMGCGDATTNSKLLEAAMKDLEIITGQKPVLTELSRLAEEYKCAMVLVAHMSKMSSNSALYRALGSIDIVALARSELILVNKPDDPERHKILAHEKSSLAAHGNSIEFHIDYDAGGIVFDGYSDLKADDILGQKKEVKRSTVALDEAKEFLEEMLSDGYADLKEIMKEAENRGIKRDTVYRAKKEMNLLHRAQGYGSNKSSIWHYKDYIVPKNNIS